MSNEKKILFRKKNYIILIFSICLISLGYLLMSGGGSDDPNIFNEEIYSFRRIRLAPILVVTGFIIEVYAILTKSE